MFPRDIADYVAAAMRGVLKLKPLTSAPASPENGSLWTTAAGLFVRTGGSTKQLADKAALDAAIADLPDLALIHATVLAR